MKVNSIKIFCDGGARGNPGPAAWAYVVYAKGKKVQEDTGFLGVATNNVAEYQGVIHSLVWLLANKNKLRDEHIYYQLDSELVVNQLNGRYKVKSQNLKPLIMQVKKLEKQSGLDISYQHISRNENETADSLVNRTLDASVT